MKTIRLTQGQVALVDDQDFEFLSQWKWCAVRYTNGFYAARHGSRRLKPRPFFYMHRVILGAKKGQLTDHENGIGTHNYRKNLRLCNHKQNRTAFCSKPGGTSKFRGVHWHARRQKWKAQIQPSGKLIYLGHFDLEEDAARAYDKKAKELYGEFAQLNFAN